MNFPKDHFVCRLIKAHLLHKKDVSCKSNRKPSSWSRTYEWLQTEPSNFLENVLRSITNQSLAILWSIEGLLWDDITYLKSVATFLTSKPPNVHPWGLSIIDILYSIIAQGVAKLSEVKKWSWISKRSISFKVLVSFEPEILTTGTFAVSWATIFYSISIENPDWYFENLLAKSIASL